MQSKYWLDVEMASTMLLCILCNNISWVIEFSVTWIYKFSNCLLINCWPNSSVSNAFTLVVSDMECGLDTAKLLLKFCFLLIVIKKTSVKFCHHKRQTAKSVYLRLTYVLLYLRMLENSSSFLPSKSLLCAGIWIVKLVSIRRKLF